jgi:hypothetical protein
MSATFGEPNLVSWAGLARIVALAGRAGLAGLLAEHLSLPDAEVGRRRPVPPTWLVNRSHGSACRLEGVNDLISGPSADPVSDVAVQLVGVDGPLPPAGTNAPRSPPGAQPGGELARQWRWRWLGPRASFRQPCGTWPCTSDRGTARTRDRPRLQHQRAENHLGIGNAPGTVQRELVGVRERTRQLPPRRCRRSNRRARNAGSVGGPSG